MTTTDPLIGRKLGDYKIEGLLGSGGMARVYRGYDDQLDRYAAVKVTEPHLVASADEEEYRERFLREARAIARLSHPNIVGVYQFGQVDSLYYIAMEYVQGRNLREILKSRAKQGELIPVEDMMRVLEDTAKALDYAHTQNIIHRDVKPSNIIVDGEHKAVLTDFGLALNAVEGTIGNTFGSVHYIAPEQAISSAQATSQSDQYSLAIVAYEMLTGQVPFDDASAMSVALKHISDPPPPPTEINPNIPQEVEDVLIKALDKDAQKRYTRCIDFIEALQDAFNQTEETLEPPPLGTTLSPTATAGLIGGVGAASGRPAQEDDAPTIMDAAERPFVAPSMFDLEKRSEEISRMRQTRSSVRETQPLTAITEPPPEKDRRSSLPLAGIAVIGVLLIAVAAIVFVVLPSLNNNGGDDPTLTQTALAQAIVQAANQTATAGVQFAAAVQLTADEATNSAAANLAATNRAATQDAERIVLTASQEAVIQATENAAMLLATQHASQTQTIIAIGGAENVTEVAQTPSTSVAQINPTLTATLPEPTATDTLVPSATNTFVPTATDTLIPTATNTSVPTATDTLIPTATNTSVPTATDTLIPTATNTSVSTATDTLVPTTTNTSEPLVGPSLTPTRYPTPGFVLTDDDTDELLLRYNGRSLTVYNRATQNEDVDDLTFHLFEPNQNDRFIETMQYEASEWGPLTAGLRPERCLQVWTVLYRFIEADEPPGDHCASRTYFRQTSRPFWISDFQNADAFFEVRRGNVVLQSCPVARPRSTTEFRCTVDLPD